MMNRNSKTKFWILLVTAIFAAASWSHAQDSEKNAVDQETKPLVEAGPKITLKEVEAALAELEANNNIESAVKDGLRVKYTKAIEHVKKAETHKNKQTEFKNSVKTAPDETKSFKQKLDSLPLVEDAAIDIVGSADELQKRLVTERAALDGLKNNFSELEKRLALVKARPAAIGQRIPTAEGDLVKVQRDLAALNKNEDPTSPGRKADQLLLQAKELELTNELEMLKQEQLSQAVRQNLLQANLNFLNRKIKNATAVCKTLEGLTHESLTREAGEVNAEIAKAVKNLPVDDADAQQLATEVGALADEFQTVVENLKEVVVVEEEVSENLKRLEFDYESVRQQLEAGGSDTVMARMMFDLQARLPNQRTYFSELSLRIPSMDDARLASLKVEKKIRDQSAIEKKFENRSSESISRLVNLRAELLEKLREQYNSLIPLLGNLNKENGQLLAKSDEINDYVWEQFFWIRTQLPVSKETFTSLPQGIAWLFKIEHGNELGNAIVAAFKKAPVRCGLLLLATLVILFCRRRIIPALIRTGELTRRVSTDRFAHTARALLYTVLLAAPVPLILVFVWYALELASEPSDWLIGLKHGLRWAFWIAAVFEFLIVLWRPGGLGIVHFRWQAKPLNKCRTGLIRFAVVFLPAVLIVASTFRGDAVPFAENIGRVSFILAHLWLTIILWRLFFSSHGLFDDLAREIPNSLLTKTRYVWSWLLFLGAVALIILSWNGFLITAIVLSQGVIFSLAILGAGTVLYGLAVRWFRVKKRRLALEEALERRRTRLAAIENEPVKRLEGSGEGSLDDPIEVEKLDLDLINDQTQHLLRMVIGLGVAIGILVSWSGTIPLIPYLENIPMPGGLTLLDVGKAVVIVIALWVGVKNLPGLLELSVLRTTKIAAGTRYAISRLSQYILIAIGLMMLFTVLKVDWSKFGWIAAALSVGLGFGLQEVVANFVCGLILLFERPIRVGDIVTIENVTGTVTKIQMRSTTVRNYDRQELVIPNKILITNTILNWTLSASTNRVVIPVGVAYGTDTEKARQILLEIAQDHPAVLEDPTPITSFEKFADSSLSIVLRAYLPDLDNRLNVITELNTEIDRRFAAEEIEIAFPQLDLHLKGELEPASSDFIPRTAAKK